MKKKLLIAIGMMVSLCAHAQRPYFGHKLHHSKEQIFTDLDDGMTKARFLEDQARGWNLTLDSLASVNAGGRTQDAKGVSFTFMGETFNLRYLNAADMESVIAGSRIVTANIDLLVTSKWYKTEPYYCYFSRHLRDADGVKEKFFAKSLGEVYNQQKLMSIIFLFAGDICGNPNKFYVVLDKVQAPTPEQPEEDRPEMPKQQPTSSNATPMSNYQNVVVNVTPPPQSQQPQIVVVQSPEYPSYGGTGVVCGRVGGGYYNGGGYGCANGGMMAGFAGELVYGVSAAFGISYGYGNSSQYMYGRQYQDCGFQQQGYFQQPVVNNYYNSNSNINTNTNNNYSNNYSNNYHPPMAPTRDHNAYPVRGGYNTGGVTPHPYNPGNGGGGNGGGPTPHPFNPGNGGGGSNGGQVAPHSYNPGNGGNTGGPISYGRQPSFNGGGNQGRQQQQFQRAPSNFGRSMGGGGFSRAVQGAFRGGRR